MALSIEQHYHARFYCKPNVCLVRARRVTKCPLLAQSGSSAFEQNSSFCSCTAAHRFVFKGEEIAEKIAGQVSVKPKFQTQPRLKASVQVAKDVVWS